MAGVADTFRRRWSYRGDDPAGLAAYVLEDGEVDVPSGAELRPLRVWMGGITDRCRLDLVTCGVLGPTGVQPVVLELQVRAGYGCLPAFALVLGTVTWADLSAELQGFVVQVSGVLAQSWELWGRVTGGNVAVRLGVRAMVDRVGGPVAVSKGLLV